MKTLKTILWSLLLTAFTISNGFGNGTEKAGVLVLAHGGSNAWNQHVEDAVKPLREKYPVEVAYGMALPRTIQAGIDKLEARGVNKIVVVPLFISSHSFIIRQTEFLLGIRDTLADPPLVMDHSHGSSNGSGHHGAHGGMDHGHTAGMNHRQDVTLEPLEFESEIVFTGALDDHPVVAEILYNRVKELSTDPSEETVILVGHGPNPEKDNKKWVAAMENLAEQVMQQQKESGAAFHHVLAVTVRDDADKAIHEQAKEHLRSLVRQTGKQGEVIVVPLLLSRGGIEKGIVKRLEGLDYKWSGKTLLPDPLITRFIESSVSAALSK